MTSNDYKKLLEKAEVDYRKIPKSAPIVLILKSELDVPILQLDVYVVTVHVVRYSKPTILLDNHRSTIYFM